MLGFYVIFFVGIIVWIVPPIKQYKTSYFNFFLVAAVFGPLMIFYTFILKLNVNYLYPTFYLLQLASLINKPWRNILYVLSAFLLITIPLIKIGSGLIFGICILIELIILIIIVQSFIKNLISRELINVFLLLLIIFLSTDIFKLSAVAMNLEKGVVQFFVGSSVQILFGILFSLINENTKLIPIRVPK